MTILMTSCLETFTPDVDIKPVLCLNSCICAGKPIEVNITHTWFYSDGEKLKDHSVDDAILSIYVNNREVERDYLPQEGDKIRIHVSSKKYGEAEAEVVVPVITPIKNLDWKIDIISSIPSDENNLQMFGYILYNLLIKAEIQDVSENPNYYRISFESFSPYTPLNPEQKPNSDYWNDKSLDYYCGYLEYEAEPIFFENLSESELVFEAYPAGFGFFTDRQFSGSNYTLNLHFENARYFVESENWDESLLDVGMTVTLHSVSKSYYDWEVYYRQIDSGLTGDLIDWGFHDPIWGYSNVSTGAGLVAAQSSITYVVSLKDYLEKLLKKPAL